METPSGTGPPTDAALAEAAGRLLQRARGEGAGAQAGRPAPAARSWTVSLNRGAPGVPVVFVPGLYGETVIPLELVRELGYQGPVHGFRPPDLDWHAHGLVSLDQMADHLLGRLLALHPEGPYLLAGASAGGGLAFELACRLRARGSAVVGLLLGDTPLPLHPHHHIDAPVTPTQQELASNPVLSEGIRAARALHAALRDWVPGTVLDLPIDFAWSMAFARPAERDRRTNWARFTSAGVRLHPVDCEHRRVFSLTNRRPLMEMISRMLTGAVDPRDPGLGRARPLPPAREVVSTGLFSEAIVVDDATRIPIVPTLRRPGHLDVVRRAAGRILLEGWARDPVQPGPAKDVLFFLAGRYAGRGLLGRPRPDVEARFGTGGESGFGFVGEIEVEDHETQASHPLRAFAVGSGRATALRGRWSMGW